LDGTLTVLAGAGELKSGMSLPSVVLSLSSRQIYKIININYLGSKKQYKEKKIFKYLVISSPFKILIFANVETQYIELKSINIFFFFFQI
jgi:hypothetical protein